MKVRIKREPQEREIDGVSLKGMVPGTVRDVPSVLGSWLITEGYADTEMRQSMPTNELDGPFTSGRHSSEPRERRARKR